jgi:hypothetical protein
MENNLLDSRFIKSFYCFFVLILFIVISPHHLKAEVNLDHFVESLNKDVLFIESRIASTSVLESEVSFKPSFIHTSTKSRHIEHLMNWQMFQKLFNINVDEANNLITINDSCAVFYDRGSGYNSMADEILEMKSSGMCTVAALI